MATGVRGSIVSVGHPGTQVVAIKHLFQTNRTILPWQMKGPTPLSREMRRAYMWSSGPCLELFKVTLWPRISCKEGGNYESRGEVRQTGQVNRTLPLL